MIKTKNAEQKGYLLIFAAGLLWGFIGVFVMLMSAKGSSSELTSFLRVAFAFVILAVITIAKFGLKALKISKKTLLLCALLGLICHGIYNVFYSIAVTESGVALSAVMLNIAPFFTALLSRMIFSEKITTIKTIALVINVGGCILAATGGSFASSAISWIGLVCGFAAGFCYSLTAIIGRSAGNDCNVFVISTYSYFFAACFLAIYMRPWSVAQNISFDIIAIGFLYALIPTAIAYIFYYEGLKIVTESSKVPVIASIETVVAAVLGVVFYSESLGAANITGIILVLISIMLMNKKQRNAA